MPCSTIDISLSKREREDLAAQIRKTHERKMADRLRVILYRAECHDILFRGGLLFQQDRVVILRCGCEEQESDLRDRDVRRGGQ